MRQTTVLLMVCAVLMTACHEDDTPQPLPVDTDAWTVSAVGYADSDGHKPTLNWRASYESLKVSICGRTEQTKAVVVESDNEWLSVASDTLAADSIILLVTTNNSTGKRREATLSFIDANDAKRKTTLTVVQLSQSDQSTNGDPRDQLYIGYGYDIYKALESPMAVRTRHPIIDFDKLKQVDMGSYQVVQDCHLAHTNIKYVATNDIHAYGRDLSEQQTEDQDNHFEGCNQNCITVQQLVSDAKGVLEQQNFGHGTLEKCVASRVVDRAALLDLKRNDLIPFTDEFNEQLIKIRYQLKDDERREAVEQTIVDFGTHLIIQVDLGGRIDYTFSMHKTATFNTEEEMKQEVDYTLGRMADSDRSMKNRSTSTSKSAENAITVLGGSESTRNQLENDINGLSASGQIDPLHITDWMASINYSNYFEQDKTLEIIHFELIPVWDIVPDELRQDFFDATFRLAQRSDCSLPASFTGTDVYKIDVNNNKLFEFDSDASSLCRLFYVDGNPVVQVCSEYVPKIRTDRRVVIAYPIYKQKIRMNQGLFLGDGTQQPAYVGFSGADCYVDPLEDYKPGDRINTFYYVNGNLLINSPSVAIKTNAEGKVEDDFYMYLGNKDIRHPIVKVGSSFWTRHDIDHEMGFTDDPESRSDDGKEYVIDDVLYTRFYFDLGYYASKDNSWIWGYQPNTNFEGNPNTKWYLPTTEMVKNLYAFLGFNPKALYRGQESGWDAQFNGYYGIHDIVNGKSFDDGHNNLRYKGQYNFIATHTNEEGTDNAMVLALDGSYHMKLYTVVGDWHEDYYPLRPVRGYMFTYPTLKDIEQNTL